MIFTLLFKRIDIYAYIQFCAIKPHWKERIHVCLAVICVLVFLYFHLCLDREGAYTLVQRNAKWHVSLTTFFWINCDFGGKHTWDLSKIWYRRIFRPKIVLRQFHLILTVFEIKTPKKWVKMEKFTPLTKLLHCRRQWQEGQISPLEIRWPFNVLYISLQYPKLFDFNLCHMIGKASMNP